VGRNAQEFPNFFFFQISLVGGAHAAKLYQRVEVTDPFIELRTGPGRSYPIFYVAERGEKVEILKRRTDWFKVRTERGKKGWVDRAQMENTLVDAGVKKSFRDLLVEEYIRRRVEVGFAVGEFEDETVTRARAGISLGEHFMAELSIGQVSGSFSSSRLIDVNLVAYPAPEWRVSPYFTLGVGKFKNDPKGTLVGANSTEDTSANAAIGVRFHATRKLMIRGDLRTYVVFIDDDRTDDFQELTIGFGFLF
jgi:hypothetical protein